MASTPTKWTRSAGIASTINTEAETGATRPGRRMTQAASRAQRPPEGTCCSRFGASASILRAEPVEERRQRNERDEAGRERDEHAADAHRVEELLREDEQAGHRRRDGQCAEDDGASRGPHRGGKSLGTMPVPRRLLAPARDDEQRVVDREAETETRDEVEREDRERMHLDRDPEPEERERDRAGPDERRQKRRDEAAEDPERQQQDERERDQLGAAEIALDRGGHLAGRDRAAAEPHLRIAGECREQPVGRLLGGVAAARVQERENDPVPSTAVRATAGSRSIRARVRATTAGPPVTSASTPGSASTPVLPLDLEIGEAALRREVGELGRPGLHARDHRAPDPERGDEQSSGDERDERSPGRNQVQHGSRHGPY